MVTGLTDIDFEMSAANLDDLDAMYDALRGTPGITVDAVQAPVTPGEQGGILELLTVACSGGAITVFLEIIKTVVESRGTTFALRIRRGRGRDREDVDLQMNSDNADEILSAIRKVLGES